MRLLVLFSLLILFSSFIYADEETPAYGPVITFAEKDIDDITIFYYTDIKEKGGIYISNDQTNYTFIESKKRKYHDFEIETEDLTFIYYKILSTTREIKGASGTIRLPNYLEYTVGIYGNTFSSFDNHQAISYQMAMHEPSFVIHTGNIVEDTYSHWMYEQFFQSGSVLLSKTAIIPVIGVSDFYNSIWKRTFDVSNSREPFYSYQLPLMNLIVLNTTSYYGEDSFQYQWLIEELNKTDPDDWLVVAFHQSPFKQPEINEYYVPTDFDHILDTFEDYGVDVVYTGNLYLYERSKTNGITFINAGGAFENMFGTSYNNPAREKIVLNENFYVIMEVNDYYLNVTAYDLLGNIFDTVDIFKND